MHSSTSLRQPAIIEAYNYDGNLNTSLIGRSVISSTSGSSGVHSVISDDSCTAYSTVNRSQQGSQSQNKQRVYFSNVPHTHASHHHDVDVSSSQLPAFSQQQQQQLNNASSHHQSYQQSAYVNNQFAQKQQQKHHVQQNTGQHMINTSNTCQLSSSPILTCTSSPLSSTASGSLTASSSILDQPPSSKSSIVSLTSKSHIVSLGSTGLSHINNTNGPNVHCEHSHSTILPNSEDALSCITYRSSHGPRVHFR